MAACSYSVVCMDRCLLLYVERRQITRKGTPFSNTMTLLIVQKMIFKDLGCCGGGIIFIEVNCFG